MISKKTYFIMLVLISLLFYGCAVSSKPVYVKLDIKTLRYGTVYVGEADTLEFKIINNSVLTYEITDIQITGTNASEFAITSGWAGEITVQSKSELVISVEFTPQSVGTKSAQIEISHNYPNEDSPKTIELVANSTIDARLEATPTKYHFGFIPVGDSADKEIEFENTGTNPLDVTAVTFMGNGANNYEVKTGWTNNPVHIDPAGKHIIEVKFSPNSDGDKIARMKVEHTGSNSPVYVNLTGGGGYGYIMEEFAVGMTSIRGTGTDILTSSYDDDVWFNFSLGFTFKFFGRDYSSIWICDNGWVSFGADPFDPAYENFILPCTGVPESAIYPFWDDVEFNQANIPEAKWVYEVQGSAPNRVFVVEWYRLNRYNSAPVMYATYQLRLYETTNIIEFHYSTGLNDWINSSWSATIGLEDSITGKYYQITGSPSINKRPLNNYRFIP